MSEGSVIGSNTVVRGSVLGQSSLEISGRVEGDVQVTGDVSVGETGAVLGNISASTIRVLGRVQGNLQGSEAVLVERGGKVVGDLTAPRIGIASGALVRGSVRTEGEPTAAAPRRPLVNPAQRPAPFVAKVEPKLPPVAAVTKVAAAPVRVPALPAKVAAPPVRPPPPAKSEPQVAPAPRAHAPVQVLETKSSVERRPPPPVLPSLGKGVKAIKKKSREE